MDKAKLLAGSSLFCELEQRDLEKIAQHATQINVRKGQIIIAQGNTGESMYCVIKGRFKVSRRIIDPEREIGLAILNEGECFGEMALLGRHVRSANVTAMEHGELLVLQRCQLDDYLLQNPTVMRSLIGILSDRLALANNTVEDSMISDLPRRVAKFLRQLAPDHGVAHPEGVQIDLDLRRSDIASFVGTGREPISRLLTDWRNAGLIDTHMRGGKMIVHDFDKLPG